jgi:hypothetical protein
MLGSSGKWNKEGLQLGGHHGTRNSWLVALNSNVADSNVRAEFVFSIAVIFQRLAQPAAGLAVAGVYVANPGARIHQPVA